MTAEKGAAQQISFQSVAAPRLRQCILPAPRAQAYHPGTGQVSAAKGTSCLHLPALAQRARGPQAQVSACEGYILPALGPQAQVSAAKGSSLIVPARVSMLGKGGLLGGWSISEAIEGHHLVNGLSRRGAIAPTGPTERNHRTRCDVPG